MPPSKLLLYPQLLLTCFAMLPTTYMHLYALIIDLLQKVDFLLSDSAQKLATLKSPDMVSASGASPTNDWRISQAFSSHRMPPSTVLPNLATLQHGTHTRLILNAHGFCQPNGPD